MKTSIHRLRLGAPHALAAALALALAGAAQSSHARQPGNAARPGATPQNNFVMADPLDNHERLRAAFRSAAAAIPAATAPARAPAIRRVQSLADTGPGSLRETLASAVNGDVIDLSQLHGRITLSSALTTSADVVIQGPGRDRLTIDGAHRDRVIASRGSLTLSGVSIVNGAVAGVDPNSNLGGCMFHSGDLQLVDAVISGCSIGDANLDAAVGGGVAVYGNLDAKYTTVSDNTATGHEVAGGGGVFTVGKTSLYRSTVSGNHANQVMAPKGTAPSGDPYFYAAGGGIMALSSYASSLALSSTISGNTASAVGGDVEYDGTTYHVDGDALGGGVFGWAAVVNSTISGNSLNATDQAYGGGIYVLKPSPHRQMPDDGPSAIASLTMAGVVPRGGSAPTFKYSSITGNSATSSGHWAYGGGVMTNGSLAIYSSAISSNTVTGANGYWTGGGGIFAQYGTLGLIDSTISDNVATSASEDAYSWGAGILAMWNAPLAMSNSTISGNHSSAAAHAYSGGVVASMPTISNSTITANTAARNGGGLTLYNSYDSSFTPSVASTIIAGNIATDDPQNADVFTYIVYAVNGDHNLVIAGSDAIWATDTPLNADPQLLPLAFNGGPTKTHALPPGSPAIDAGSNPLDLDTDQRGYARVVGAAADIGAYELDTDRIFASGFNELGG